MPNLSGSVLAKVKAHQSQRAQLMSAVSLGRRESSARSGPNSTTRFSAQPFKPEALLRKGRGNCSKSRKQTDA